MLADFADLGDLGAFDGPRQVPDLSNRNPEPTEASGQLSLKELLEGNEPSSQKWLREKGRGSSSLTAAHSYA